MVATVIAAGVVAPAGASAETLLGSTLSDHYEGTTFGGEKVTVYQVGAPSETVAAPGPGTITSWSVRSGDMNAKYELRVIRPAAGGTYIAAGTSTPFTVPDAEDKVRGPFATHLPIKAGDRIALDVLSGLGAPVHLTLEPDELNYLQDPYVEGESKLPVLLPPLSATQELLLAATFVPGGPASTSPPTISGEAREGSTLTGSEGGWEGATSFTYQWLRCATATATNCVLVPGATGPSYTLVHADIGSMMRLRVTAMSPLGSATAESAPTATVLPILLKARFSQNPDPTCTGISTEFNASGSTTPDPPLRYEFLLDPTLNPEIAFKYSQAELEAEGVTGGEPELLASGASPIASYTFSWAESETHPGEYFRELYKIGAYPVLVTLVISDASGATTVSSRIVDNAQGGGFFPSASRNTCPHFRLPPGFLGRPTRISVISNSITARINCATTFRCEGAVSIFAAIRLGTAAGSAPHTRRGPLVIAANPFFTIRGHHSVTVRARLTSAGRALLKRGKKVKAILQVTTLKSRVATSSSSYPVTLRGK